MRIEEVKISPQQAREWLAIEPERVQRTLRKRNLAKLKHAIDAGEWRLTHQAIAIAPNGFVLDGRHRLTAIGSQRKHVTAMVAFDSDPATFDAIDTGAARSPADTLKVAGYTDVNVLAAAARQVKAYPDIMGTTNTLTTVTNPMTSTEVLAAVEDPDMGKIVQDAISPGHRIAGGVGRYGYRTSATALVALINLYSQAGEDTRLEFVVRLADGAHLEPSSPILALRRWIITETGYPRIIGTYRTTAAMVAGIRAWNNYAAGKPRESIRYRPGVDVMPEID